MTDLITENTRLWAALAYYADQLCEGFCNDLPEAGTYHISMDDRCSGCKARAALATPAPDVPLPEHERDGFGRPVNPATPQEAVHLGQHSVAPAHDAVQEAARVLLGDDVAMRTLVDFQLRHSATASAKARAMRHVQMKAALLAIAGGQP